MITAPKFWQKKNLFAYLFLPLSWLVTVIAYIKYRITTPYESKAHIICVGNVTVGGAGKTPTTQFLYKTLSEHYADKKIIVVSKGYLGTITEPTIVNPQHHTATHVGDEPLMLAHTCKVIVGKNRIKAIQFAERNGADIIIMDDGLQNPTIKKDKIVLVFDGLAGIQNGWNFPSGPIRPLGLSAISKADIIIVTGEVNNNTVHHSIKPILNNHPMVFFPHLTIQSPLALQNQSVLAFTGINNPQKFYKTLRKNGAMVTHTMDFPNHYFYTQDDINTLKKTAHANNTPIVTTHKDYVRLTHDQQNGISLVTIQFHFDTIMDIKNIIRTL